MKAIRAACWYLIEMVVLFAAFISFVTTYWRVVTANWPDFASPWGTINFLMSGVTFSYGVAFYYILRMRRDLPLRTRAPYLLLSLGLSVIVSIVCQWRTGDALGSGAIFSALTFWGVCGLVLPFVEADPRDGNVVRGTSEHSYKRAASRSQASLDLNTPPSAQHASGSLRQWLGLGSIRSPLSGPASLASHRDSGYPPADGESTYEQMRRAARKNRTL